jgi:hypothetical protein
MDSPIFYANFLVDRTTDSGNFPRVAKFRDVDRFIAGVGNGSRGFGGMIGFHSISFLVSNPLLLCT